MPNIELVKIREVPTFRKIAIGTWQTTYDPTVYGTIEVDMDKGMDYLRRFREATGIRLTVSHLMAKAAAAALVRIPEANGILRYNRPYRRKNIGIFFQVAMVDQGDDKVDLSGACIYDVEQKSLAEIAREFDEKVQKVRKREDPALEKTRNTFSKIPFWFINRFFKLISFLSYTLNLDLRWAGVPKDPFGSLMITNVGSLGLDVAYVPLVPYSRVPMLLAVGAVKEVPAVRDGQIVITKQMKINATFDHRFIDGYHAAVMSRVLHAWFGDPDQYFGEIPAPVPRLPEPSAA
jgi:pyruvate dehydrogenase E2 component (dihydrolipoamide acetyltransferase)